MDTHKLSLVGLTKQYAQGIPPAVDRLDMNVEEGHLVSLLGPSGCGKTTTLRMVAGLMDPTAGRILVDGNEITNTPVHKRGMGMVFQSYALFPHMNVHENVAFGLQMRKKSKKDQEVLVRKALEMVQLDHLAKRQVRALSGGQQQRIALARALVVEPTLLLLDEPLSNLDAKLRETMRTEIRQIQQRSGATTLFVTHDQDEALDMSDRIAVMNGGLIEQFGSPVEVYERPRTRFVANFIGRANLLRVTVRGETPHTRGDSRYGVEIDGFGTFEAIGESGLAGERDLLIRPHRLRAEPASSGAEGIRGVVESLSYTGDALGYSVRVGDRLFSAERLTSGADRMDRGDEAVLSWRAEDALVLPEDVEGSAP
ncbi:ABC transporter ATP-binding protein [Microbacterium sp. gxy059]|uniref:ABC transporter ATP-binding protein n=1 Tax=Microbacterium sp. gxy059 TaxID=2957199 RepID=UPI003D997B06